MSHPWVKVTVEGDPGELVRTEDLQNYYKFKLINNIIRFLSLKQKGKVVNELNILQTLIKRSEQNIL